MTKYKPQKELQHFWEAEGITMILVAHDVEEAVYPGDRVVVMEPRPRPHPAHRAGPAGTPANRMDLEFVGIKEDILGEFGIVNEVAEYLPARQAA